MNNQIETLRTMVAALQEAGVEIEMRFSPIETGVIMTAVPGALDNVRAFLHASDYLMVQTESNLMEFQVITFNSVRSQEIMQNRMMELCDEWGFAAVKESLITGVPNTETAEFVAQGIFVGSMVAAEADPQPDYSVVKVLRDPLYRQFLVTNGNNLSDAIEMNEVLPFLDSYVERFEATQA